MKTRTKALLTASVAVALSAGAVVHTTNFPKPGVSGVQSTAPPSIEIDDLASRLEETTRILCLEIGTRNLHQSSGQSRTIDMIYGAAQSAGFEVTEQEYKADKRKQMNVIAEKRGKSRDLLLVVTHYDSYRRSPSADASASAVVAMFEMMRVLATKNPRKTVRFVFLGTGEGHLRGTEHMGAHHYAQALAKSEANVDLILVLDSIGYYSSEEGSQNFIFPLNFVFPKTGDFLAVLGGLRQRGPVERVLEAWGRVSDVPARGGSIPSWFPGVRSGDQDPFAAAGFTVVQLTDTGGARFGDIRSAYDNFHRLNYPAFARVVQGLGELVVELADS